MSKNTALAFCIWFALTAAGLAGGMLVPSDSSLPALEIKNQRVTAEIKDGAASVRIEQVFLNTTGRELEAVYVFPLPENAAINDFAMYINGRRISGELVEKDKAREMYQDMIRRLRDPALLERMSGNLFKARVFPVPAGGEQRIEIAYSQTIPFDSGLYRFEYPLKTYGPASRVREDFSVSVKISSSRSIKSVYSPSHEAGVSRRGEHEAIIGLEERRAVLDRDFVLYYSVSDQDFGLNLLTRRVGDEDGFFMLMLAPRAEPGRDEILERDIVFVLDTSGSMAGDKIAQAREALKYCVHRLNPGDRFNVIRFSSDVEAFHRDMVPAEPDMRNEALAFIDRFRASGGTDIAGALAEAVAMETAAERQKAIVFLTDGLPTVGVFDPNEILARTRQSMRPGTRLFVFGVGDDVNTRLLDRLSTENSGLSQYVRPGENIEVTVSAFYDKISLPVLCDPEIRVSGAAVNRLHPGKLPDLFAGSQVMVFGRYRGGGRATVTLAGNANGKRREWNYEAFFPEHSADNEFIPALWATRRMGFLLDQIRLAGAEKELEDEIIELGKEYGIMTPYTSYLVLEPGAADAEPVTASRVSSGTAEDKAGHAASAPAQPAAPRPFFGRVMSAAPSAAASDGGGALEREESRQSLRRETGREAVEMSMAIGKYKAASARDRDSEAPSVRRVGSRVFHLRAGVWIDEKYREGMKLVKVKYASEEYFALIEKTPELRQCLALGERVIVCLDERSALSVE